jgi:hypothetical protein
LKTAIDLCPTHADAWYYRHLCEKRLGNSGRSDYALAKAREYGSGALRRGDDPTPTTPSYESKAQSAVTPTPLVEESKSGPSEVTSGGNDKRPKDNRVTTSKQKRYALIIGNGDYTDARLLNPVNDARDMAKILRESGFQVVQLENLTRRGMLDEIKAFGSRLKFGGVGLFYFSGHGVQLDGYNYLLPIRSNIEKEQDIQYEGVEAGIVLGEMEAAKNELNIVILDACRNNPFARSFRSATRGLAMMNAPSGTVIIYSTAPGKVASDGAGKNGLYTKELLENIQRPGLKLEDVLKLTRIAVEKESGGKQVPWETSSLKGDFYFRNE